VFLAGQERELQGVVQSIFKVRKIGRLVARAGQADESLAYAMLKLGDCKNRLFRVVEIQPA